LKKGEPEELARMAEEVIRARKRTQPLRRPSAGSIFKNPPLDHAGRLIQAVGLKGARIGDAQVSLKHANFIVNCGAATASDVLELIALIRSKVKEQFQQELDLEIVHVASHIQAERPERKAGQDELKAGTRCCSSMRSVL
jgi:UDP-N-acetylmuramate dehydrogenase